MTPDTYNEAAPALYPDVIPAESWIDTLCQRWLAYWHGRGAPHQYQYYRCKECKHLVTHRQIAQGACRHCGGVKVAPAFLRRLEKVRLLCLPWTIK